MRRRGRRRHGMNLIIPTYRSPSTLSTVVVLSCTIFLLALNTVVTAAATQPTIQGIRTISSAGTTRVVISLSAPIRYELIPEHSSTTSPTPSRLHIRFSPAHIASGIRTAATVDDGILKEVRTGLLADSIVRVSLVVDQLGTYRATTYRSPDQVVILLRKQAERRMATRSLPPPPSPVSSVKEPVERHVTRTTSDSPPQLKEQPSIPPSSRPALSPPQEPTEHQAALTTTAPPSPPVTKHQQPPVVLPLPSGSSARDSVDQRPVRTPPPSPPEPVKEPTDDRQAVLTPPRPSPVSPAPQSEEPPAEPGTSDERYRIMIDPGHGGSDPGAIGVNGLQEKNVVLAVSKRLAYKLRKRLGAEVVLTRTTDTFIPLPERTARANAAKADLFVSIHANASPNSETHGIETYYLNNTNDRATIRLAKLENGIRAKQQLPHREASLSYILSDLIQTGKEEESVALAEAVQTALVDQARTTTPSARDLGVKQGPFYVLVGAHMPCVLVELAFLTHEDEGPRLGSATYQETLAEGLFLGIADFLRTGLSAKNL